jgi:acyl-CoA thioesterase-1
MKIVCIGDSFTRGFGVNKKESWFRQLSESFNQHTFINKGINGDTSGGMLARFERDVISQKPKYVLIIGGVNDFICSASVSSVQANIMAMAHQAYHNSIIPIIGNVPECIPDKIRGDWKDFTDFNIVLKKQLELQRWRIDFCDSVHVNFIDFFEQFPKRIEGASLNDYYIDGLHLKPSGHKIIHEIAYEEFKKIL